MKVLQSLRRHIKKFEDVNYVSIRIAKRFGKNSRKYKKVMQACVESAKTHNGGRRKNGDLLISHERGLVAIADYLDVSNYFVYIALFLHDMNEDYEKIWPLKRIRMEYGYIVSRMVYSLTKPVRTEYDSDEEYDVAIFDRVRSGGYWSMVMKCIDRLHNMLTMWGSREKVVNKINQTIKYVLPISIDCNTLTYELMVATTEQARRFKLNPTAFH